MQIIMAARYTRQTLILIKLFNLFRSKNSPFHLFIFLIGLSIGVVCSFYFPTFTIAIQSSIFSVSRSLSSISIPLPASQPPPSPSILQHIDALASLTSPPLLTSNLPQLPPSQPPIVPPPHTDSLSLSPLSQPPPPLSTLSNIADDLSSLASPVPPPLVSPPLVTSSGPQLPPSQPPLSQSPAPLPLLLESNLSPRPLSSIPPPGVSMNKQIPMMHNMSDEDLVQNLLGVSTMRATNDTYSYKVAFMFLTPGPLPLSPLWELFFKGHTGLYSIYVHPHPSYNDTIPQDSVFYGTRITSQPVYWGDISMVDAERRLLANALLDPLNQRFLLLSDSCIPLFNFTTTYNYLVNSNLSYINSFDDKRKSGRGRYNPQMSPNITIQDWRKGSQWFEVNRDLALGIVVEQIYYNVFKDYCHPPCYNDEHYLPTMVNILYGKLNSNRTITYVDWSIVGPHPRKFVGSEITEESLNSIRFGSTECVYNDNTTPMCVLFARKFTPSTLKALLHFAPLLFGTNY